MHGRRGFCTLVHSSLPLLVSNPFSLYTLSQDIVISGVYAFLFLCLALSTAVYSNLFRRYENDCNDISSCERILGDAADLDEDMGAVSVSCTVGGVVFDL